VYNLSKSEREKIGLFFSDPNQPDSRKPDPGISQADLDKQEELEKTKRRHEKFMGIFLAAVSGLYINNIMFQKAQSFCINEHIFFIVKMVYLFGAIDVKYVS